MFSLIRDYRYCTRPLIFRNFFRNIQKTKNVLRPLIKNFDIKFQSKMSCAPHSLRFRSAPSPGGGEKGYNIVYLFPIIFCNSAINDEISLNERYTEA